MVSECHMQSQPPICGTTAHGLSTAHGLNNTNYIWQYGADEQNFAYSLLIEGRFE